MRLAVIGTGYVGLVTGAGLSDFGNDVTVVGLDPATIEGLKGGDIDVYEPGLEALVHHNVEAGRMRFTTELEQAVRDAEVVIIALRVRTNADGSAELTELFEVADRIGKVIDDYKVIATKSTVPVGTTDRLAVRIGAHGSTPFGVASNPSFLKEGDAVMDFMRPGRVVIGTTDSRAADVLRRLYAPLVRGGDSIQVVDPRSAELAKYATSALLATRISFMNEVARLTEELGGDIEAVRQIMSTDPRIGDQYLFVGPGFGGTNFGNDLAMLVASARQAGRALGVVEATQAANETQKHVLCQKLQFHFGDLTGKRVAVWGLAFKPRTDDIGGSPAIALVDELLERGAKVVVHDPRAMPRAAQRYADRVELAEDMYAAADGVDALVLVTEWHLYRTPDFRRIAEAMAGKLVIDGRNVWDPKELREHGLRHVGLGRP